MRLAFSLIFLMCATPPCAATQFENKPLEAQVEALFAPERDMLNIKIAVDTLAGSAATTTKADIEALAVRLESLIDKSAPSNQKLKTLRSFLYEAGDWNAGRPFSYDHVDPLGSNPANKHLARYLGTRSGNCITMPILFVILGKRIGLDLTFALAPLHLLVKYTDDDGAVWNLEPTSGGGFTRDAWYRRELPMGDAAVANGTYLRALNGKESTAAIASFLVEYFIADGKPEKAIVAADVILRHYPDFAYLKIKRGSAYYLILKRDVIDRYPNIAEIPPDVKDIANQLYAKNISDFTAAESLGWRQADGQK